MLEHFSILCDYNIPLCGRSSVHFRTFELFLSLQAIVNAAAVNTHGSVRVRGFSSFDYQE